jgi:hypothetical protein
MAQHNLPVKTASGYVTGVRDQPKSLVARGLEAVKSRHLDTANKAQTAEAQYSIGCECDHKGDHASAVTWWMKASKQGHSAAQYSLGHAYSDGTGVSQDVVTAHAWFTLSYISPLPATEFHSPSAWECRAELEEFRNIDASVRPWFRQNERNPMTEEEIVKARALAIELAENYWSSADASAAIAETEAYEEDNHDP